MKLYRTTDGVFVENGGQFFPLPQTGWDRLLCDPALLERTREAISGQGQPSLGSSILLPPVESQEVWAAGVTYFRSRNARLEESKSAGGGDFYDRIYTARRPELFFKAVGHRVIGPGGPVRIRSDARWSVPEPELTLAINHAGALVGYTIGNDMSSRDIEGENPLYLPQAKVYDGSCAIGPCILLSPDPLPPSTGIHLEISRSGKVAFAGATTLASLKRDPQELIEYLYREQSFPAGAFLMTGTGIVPDDDFTLARGDAVRISIDGIGTLENTVA
jgi:2-dehydro-3-deoxy-D-arabinonate dehydratase